MATISKAKINIKVDLPSKTAEVTSTCEVRFSTLEMFLMRNGLRFKLATKVWGEDLGQGNWLDSDDFLFSYETLFFPDANPSSIEVVKLVKKVPLSLLNEDSGSDEVYAQFILTNLENSGAVKAKSNVIQHQYV